MADDGDLRAGEKALCESEGRTWRDGSSGEPIIGLIGPGAVERRSTIGAVEGLVLRRNSIQYLSVMLTAAGGLKCIGGLSSFWKSS